MFTKQHYDKVASEIRQFLESPDPIQPVDVVHLFTTMFEMDNPRFITHKFVDACGMTWEEYCDN